MHTEYNSVHTHTHIKGRWNWRANCFHTVNSPLELNVSIFKKVTCQCDVLHLNHSDCATVHLVQLVRQSECDLRMSGRWIGWSYCDWIHKILYDSGILCQGETCRFFRLRTSNLSCMISLLSPCESSGFSLLLPSSNAELRPLLLCPTKCIKHPQCLCHILHLYLVSSTPPSLSVAVAPPSAHLYWQGTDLQPSAFELCIY